MMKYYIGWLDDDLWDVISVEKEYKKRFQRMFNEHGLEVVLFAKDWDSFEAQMGRVQNLDAVIFDLNFATTGKPQSEEDDSGFTDARSFIRKQMISPNPVRCYVCTGRDPVQREQLLRRKPENITDDDIFGKTPNEMSEMVKKIKADLDDDNTYEKKVRRRFSKELELAGHVSPLCETYLLKAILFAFSESVPAPDEIEDKIQIFRDIIEKCLLVKCEEEKVLPPLSALGEASALSFYREVESKNGNTYRLKDNAMLMDSTTTYLFGKVINVMANDAKHVKGGLKLQIRDHIQQTNDLNLYRGMLFMTVSVLQWYSDNRDRLSREPIWYEVESIEKQAESVGDSKKEDLVSIVSVDSVFAYSEGIKIKRNHLKTYNEGMKVKILERRKNTAFDSGQYPCYVDYDKHEIVE